MDTSETYIKMCNCPEIQDKWFIKDGDWVGSEHGVVSINHINEDNKYYSSVKFQLIREDNIWLPRQDQIQEMIGTYHDDKNGRWFCWVCTMERFNRFLAGFINREFEHEIECFNKPREFKMASMEQLWLAFHMSEKYKKIWDGEKWSKK